MNKKFNNTAPYIFILLPLTGIVYQLYFVFFNKTNKLSLTALIIMLSLYLGFINGTKVLESDLAVYHEYFIYAKNVNITQYINELAEREVFFYIYTYALYYILNGSFYLYVVTSIFIMYGLYLASINIICASCNLQNKKAALFLLCAAFTPDSFVWTAHLFRQMLALSFVLYGMTLLFTGNKFWIIWLALGGYTHSSMFPSIVSAPLIELLYWLLKKNLVPNFLIKKFSIIIVVVVAHILFFYFHNYIVKILLDYLVKTPVLSRFNGDIVDETNVDPRKALIPNIYLLLLYILSVWSLTKKHTEIEKKIAMHSLMYCYLLLSLYIAGESIFLVSYRLQTSVFVFFLIMLSANFYIQKYILIFINNNVILFFVFLFISRFFYTLNNSNWTYDPLPDLIINPWLNSVLN